MNIQANLSSVIELVSCLWDCCGNQTSYLLNLEENLDSLRTAWEELKNVRDHVKQRVELTEAEHMVRTPTVGSWLKRVEAVEYKVEKVLRRGSKLVDERCLKGCCPKNCCSNHKLGKKVVKLLTKVTELNGDAKFDEVADRTRLIVGQGISENPTVGMEPLLEKALKLLEDDEVTIMAIYGMGGVGKTTLLKKINNILLKEKNGFDVVIWVVVSKELNLGRIQNEIGKRLRLSCGGDELLEVRSQAIFNMLSDKKFALLLDDCWERVDLERIGIPYPHEAGNKGDKIVFTTRSEVVCGFMEAKKKIRVECLDADKAWRLFEQKVGKETLNSDSEIYILAKMVVKECCGLPLALITIGRTMASKKTAREWRHAITVLKKSTSEFSGMGDEVFPLLKFSYDYLDDDTIRSCFLYCSLYPEDFNIENDELIKHWIGEGYLDVFDSMDEAYDKGFDIIGSLKAVCLLENGFNSDLQVKMHDVIRDLAIWINCECGERKDKFLVRARANLSEAPIEKYWKEAERISLMHNDIRFLNGAPACTNLFTLLLKGNQWLCDISDTFFQFMLALKVLNLSYTRIEHLPWSITHLIELQFLDLSFSHIKKLPCELKNLVTLKYLDLSYTRFLTAIPRGLISCLSNLHMFSLYGSEYQIRNIEDSEADSGVSLMELAYLEGLSTLGLTIHSTVILQKLLNNNKLQACTRSLKINECPHLASVEMSPSSSLETASSRLSSCYLGNLKNLHSLGIYDCLLEELTIDWVGLETEIISLFSSLETLDLYDLPRLTIKWEKGSSHQCFQKLHRISISGCNALKDLTWFLFLPNLRMLDVNDCRGLEKIINDGGHAMTIEEMMISPFSRLKLFRLMSLPKLESICEHVLPLQSLEQLVVYKCPLLYKLPFDSNSARNTLHSIEGAVEWWNMLQWKDQTVMSTFLPYFKEHSWLITGILPFKPSRRLIDDDHGIQEER